MGTYVKLMRKKYKLNQKTNCVGVFEEHIFLVRLPSSKLKIS